MKVKGISMDYISRSKDTMETFDYKWKEYQANPKEEDFTLLAGPNTRNIETKTTTINPVWVDLLLSDVKLPKEYFKGRLVLDAGCGFGRNTYALSDLGARVVAIDYTASGSSQTYNSLKDRKNVHVVRGDVNHPPFKRNVFDFVMSWGVLHHTPNTKHAFEQISKLVKKKGILWVHLYEKWTPPRYLITELVRSVLHRLPVHSQYSLCKLFVLPRFIMKRRLLVGIAQTIFTFAPTQAAAFDTFSPRYNHLTSSEQLEKWFVDTGFKGIEFTNPKTCGRTFRRWLFGGKYGGFLMCRGQSC